MAEKSIEKNTEKKTRKPRAVGPKTVFIVYSFVLDKDGAVDGIQIHRVTRKAEEVVDAALGQAGDVKLVKAVLA